MEQNAQSAFASRLRSCRPVVWEQIPDLGLYMDQVITYLERQYKGLYQPGERILTPAMVNNYVKLGLVSRPVAKKYGRDQLAQLLMICVLKQCVSAVEMRLLLALPEGRTVQALYLDFCRQQNEAFASLADALPLPSPLTCAVRGAAYRFLCGAALGNEPAKEERA